MSWTFKQSTGEMSNPEGKVVATGYAGGNCGNNPEGINNPAMQEVHAVGPLPQGVYKFDTVVLQSHLGPYAIPLIPDPTNEMFGRSAFYIHGDTVGRPRCASEGCIIMPRAIREDMYLGDDHTVVVVE